MVSALVPACKVGPNYEEPAMPVPPEWVEIAPAEPSITTEPSEDRQPSIAVPTTPPEDWWTMLPDPVLDSLIERAWRGNLDVSMARSRIRQSRAARAAANAGLLPTVNADASYDLYHADGPLFPVNTDSYDLFVAGLDASWELDLFGGVRRSIEAAQAELEAAVDAKRGVLVSVICEVARNYVEVRTSQQRVIVARENIRTLTDSLELAERLNDAGIVSDLDVTRARTQLLQTESTVPELEIRERSAIHQISILLGEPPGALIAELSDPGPVPAPVARVPIGLPSELLRRRPDVRQVERELAAATARIGVAESDLYPKVTLMGEVGVGAEDFGSMFEWSSRYFGLGPSLRWQLFSGGRILANVEAHEAIRDELLDKYKQTILIALRDAENALVGFNRRQKQLGSLSKSIESSAESVRIATERYESGIVDYLDVLDAQRSMLAVQDTAAATQGELALSVIALYKAIGGGWEHVEKEEATEAANP